MGLRDIFSGGEEERRIRAERLNDNLDPFMTVLGFLFLMLVLSERAVPAGTGLAQAYGIASLVIWGIFIAEFVLRMLIEPNKDDFFRRNWWQIPMLVLPMLRFLRLVRILRMGRAGRVFSSAVRASRSAGRKLTSRVSWIATVHAIVILAGASLFDELLPGPYTDALYAAALAATAGQPMADTVGAARIVEVALALYSVIFFASIAGSLGAFWLERREEARPVVEGEGLPA